MVGRIYGHQLDSIRAAIMQPPGPPETYIIEKIQGERYRPIHGLALQVGVPHVVVQLRFFGWVGFLIHFREVYWTGPGYVYTLDLVNSEGHCQLIGDRYSTST
jgi:hypothetical protein